MAAEAEAGGAAGMGPGSAAASSGSGGYLEHVFRTAARELFGRQLPPGPLQMKVGRNAGVCTLAVWPVPHTDNVQPTPAALRLPACHCSTPLPQQLAFPRSPSLTPCPDLKEVTLEVEGAPVLRFAAAYGFRNIQVWPALRRLNPLSMLLSFRASPHLHTSCFVTFQTRCRQPSCRD